MQRIATQEWKTLSDWTIQSKYQIIIASSTACGNHEKNFITYAVSQTCPDLKQIKQSTKLSLPNKEKIFSSKKRQEKTDCVSS